MGRKIRVCLVKGCKVAYLLVPTKPDFYSLFASSIDILKSIWMDCSFKFFINFSSHVCDNTTISPAEGVTDHMTLCNTYPYLFVALHTGIFKSSSISGRVQKYYSKPGMNQIWHYMAFVVHDQIVAWFYFWVNIFSSQMLNAGKSLKTENRSGTTQGELISPTIGTFLYSVYCSFPLPVMCVCVCSSSAT